MRIFLVLILVGLIGGAGAGWWPQADRDSDDIAEAMRLKAEAALGIRRMLRAHPEFEFQNIVVGRVLEGGHVDFRGQMTRQGRTEPVYGMVSVHCVDGLAKAECWNLTYLERNGELLSLAPSDTIEHAKITDQTLPRKTEETPAATPVVQQTTITVAAVDVTSDETQTPEPVANLTALPATHQVARPVINTRAGPGTDNPVLTRLNAGARLLLIETRGSWGNFLILDGTSGGQEVWAALSLLEEAAQ